MNSAKASPKYLKQILVSIDDFLEDRVKAIDFSYDFPDLLMESAKDIKEFNYELFVVIHDELPEICYWYEDDVEYDPKSDVLDLPHFKIKVQHEKERILACMKEKGIEV
jgi:hypothetical protein